MWTSLFSLTSTSSRLTRPPERGLHEVFTQTKDDRLARELSQRLSVNRKGSFLRHFDFELSCFCKQVNDVRLGIFAY